MRFKHLFMALLLIVGIGAVSCKYDDDELWEQVNSLNDRLTSVEAQLPTMNSGISSLSTIVNQMKNNVSVTKVETTKTGYVIHFSDGKTATISNGKDGLNGKDGQNGLNGKDGKDGVNGQNGKDAPIIGIGLIEGKYYWNQTIDGKTTWILDKEGKKLPVTGKDAVTPLLKINVSGYWMISYDNGITYTEMLDDNGKPVKAVGEKGEKGDSGNDGTNGNNGTNGDSFFSNVEVVGDQLIITLQDGTELTLDINSTGIPSDSKATANPTINPSDLNTPIPNFQTFVEEGSNNKVMRMSLTGIQTPDNSWMTLYGTEHTEQNVWIEIDGKPKGFTVINSEEVASRASIISKAKADVVFLVDNSGSMGEEAYAVATQIKSWSQKLAGTMDVMFGCVGIDHYSVNGALNITDVTKLHDYLNRETYDDTYRTVGFEGPDKEELYAKAQNYTDAGGECGGIMLHFADENFSFREGANRIYVYLTDEPNQPGDNYQNYTWNARWSVESVNSNSEHYNWSTNQGTIHTVFSDPYYENYEWWDQYNEKPWLFSDYTGGTKIIDAQSDWSNVTLEGLPVTGAITHSFIIRFNITPDLLSGKHTVKITILSKDGSVKAEKVFKNVEFVI